MKIDLDRQTKNQIDPESISLILSSSDRVRVLSDTHLSELNNSDVSLEQQLKTDVKDKASQGEYAIAIALLDCLIALYPDNAAHYNNRGLMYFRNHQIVEAFGDLSQALEIDPNLDSAYNNRANCHAVRGDLTKAIADYDLALDLNPANIRAWINQGITWRELGMSDLALENFDIALIISDALRARIYAERGRTYHLYGDWNCAVADYQTALEILARQSKSATLEHKVKDWLDCLLHPTTTFEYFGCDL